MRYLVLTDIHGNIDALDGVLAAAGAVDAHLLLGDVVGYGAGPNEVIDCVRALAPAAMIRGNHDKVIAGLEIPESFNPAALQSAAWTAETLTAEHRDWLAGLPQGPAIVDDLVEICHGMPGDEDEYLFTPRDAARPRCGPPAGVPVRAHARTGVLHPVARRARSPDARGHRPGIAGRALAGRP